MAVLARRRATYEDVLAAPRHVVAELIHGVLRTSPRPAGPQAAATSEKLPIYAQCEVRRAWLVDPILRTLDVLRLESGRWSILATHKDDARVRAEPFEAIELDLGILRADVMLCE